MTASSRASVAPLGRCCGRTWLTWTGWQAHRREHQKALPNLPTIKTNWGGRV